MRIEEEEPDPPLTPRQSATYLVLMIVYTVALVVLAYKTWEWAT